MFTLPSLPNAVAPPPALTRRPHLRHTRARRGYLAEFCTEPRAAPVIPAQAGIHAIFSARTRHDAATVYRSGSAPPPNVQRQASRA